MLETYRYSAGKFPVSFFNFKLTGEDVFAFLQNQSTFNFDLLTNKGFHLTSFLDPQGRIEFYAWALKMDADVYLLTPQLLKDQARARLERFLISEDVNIQEIGLEEWTVTLGPKAHVFIGEDCFAGEIFEEKAYLTKSQKINLPEIKPEEIEGWRCLNGWPDFIGKEFSAEIINNLRIYDLSVSINKGCYPGQETVSKIATRRGAAYSPVLLKTNTLTTTGSIYSFEKKIGEIKHVNNWRGHYYLSAKLLRDFRVENMEVTFTKDDKELKAIVTYYPLLPGSSAEKALELYYSASDFFRHDQLDQAEASFKQAIELDPALADAYESLGVMLGRQERFHEAIDLMDHLTKVDPSSVLAHTNKSLYLMRLGKIEEAEQEKSLATVKSFQKFGDEAKLKQKIADEKEKQDQEWVKRESMYRQVLEIDEEDTLANFGLGSIEVERQNWDAAIKHLQKVILADVNYSVAYLALGKAFKGSGQKEKAESIWREGIIVAAKRGDLMPANQMQFELQNL